jgi:hypothetical protein
LYFPERAPDVKIHLDVRLRSSPEDIFSALVDYPKWTEWFPNVEECYEITSLPNIKENNSKYPVGSSRRITVNGLTCEEEIIALEVNKVWALTVSQTNRPISRRWVERIVLEPTRDSDNGDDDGAPVVVGTTVRYAVGIELLWYTKLLRPIISNNIRTSWTKGLHQLDEYIIENKK